jgi:glycine betaine/proline transport system substrate-binding protein
LVVIGEAFSDATTGLVVPTYVTINSEELNANKDKFKVKLLVLVVALVHRNTIKAIDVYDLDYDQVTSGPQWWLVLRKQSEIKSGL